MWKTWFEEFPHFPLPHQLAFLIDNPIRRRLLADPVRIIDSLALTGSERVLELGPGSGFFSLEIARRLPDGQLTLFDIQPEMLDKARPKLDRAGYRNVSFHSGDASRGLPFPDSSFDVAYLATVLGEVSDRPACIGSLARVLKPGGLLVFFEQFPDPDRMSVQKLRELAEADRFGFLDADSTWWRDIVRFRRLPDP